MNHLKNNKGSSYVYTIVIVLIVCIFINFLMQFYTLWVSANNIKNATENAIISVALDNYDEMYSSEREGYTGAYKKESGSWKVNISNGDVYSKLKSGLNLKKDGNAYIKYSGDSQTFKLSNLDVNATAAIFRSSGSTTNLFNAKATIDLEMPITFLGVAVT